MSGLAGPLGSVVDTHAHFYDPHRFSYAWLEGKPNLKTPHLPVDYRAAAGPIDVAAAVFVEAAAADSSGLAEAEWVSEITADHPWVQGIVASAPLEKGEAAREDLEALLRIRQLKGIRRIVSAPFQTDPEFCLRPALADGVRLLSGYGLVFDLGVQRADLVKVRQLVHNCPNVRFVVDHMANPAISEHQLEPWRQDLNALARFPNVFCKISGMIPNAGPDWTVESLRPYVEVAIEAFGFERVMFGSDWPVMDALGGSYQRWVEALATIVAGASPAEQRRLFQETARAFYGL